MGVLGSTGVHWSALGATLGIAWYWGVLEVLRREFCGVLQGTAGRCCVLLGTSDSAGYYWVLGGTNWYWVQLGVLGVMGVLMVLGVLWGTVGIRI